MLSYSYHVWCLPQFFATDPRLILTTFVWVFTTLFTCFVSFVCSESYLPRGDVILALALSIFSVLLLPFFFVSLVRMLRPKDILLRMLGIALLESDRNSLPTKGIHQSRPHFVFIPSILIM